LCARPDQQVSDIARRSGISLSRASQSLRALNARGLLVVRRAGSLVYYRPGANPSIPNSNCLLEVIQRTLASDKKALENIFKYSTAFTHPRRILVIKILRKNPMQVKEISLKSKIHPRALNRHLRKLMTRGFLKRIDRRYFVGPIPQHEFARLLLNIATHY
jgi:DNA-binding MarR family transcriptional regulator